MALHWQQRRIAGGHVNTADAMVADGRLHAEEIWTDQLDEAGAVAGSMLSLRVVWLNGAPVRDPELSQRLLAEAMTS
jgi:hypothetical protein